MHHIRSIAFIFFLVSIVVCFVFSYQVGGFTLDIRKIPFIIGSLYLGVGPVLALLTITIRGMISIDAGFWLTVYYYGGSAILFYLLHPKFVQFSPNQRVFLSIGISFLFSLGQTISMHFNELPDSFIISAWFSYLVIQPLGVGMMAYFIEKLTEALKLRQHTVQLHKLNAVEQLGAAISHEIRNPLTAAMGFVQLLQDETLSKEERLIFLSILKKELLSAENVIKDYLTFSDFDIEHVEPIILYDQLEQIIKLLQPLANQKNVEFKISLLAGGIIEGDRQKFHQSFVNVIKNGIEAMPKGGVLTIETEFSSSHVIIRVKDTGEGMSIEQINRLGEPYYSTKGDKGTGLGLMVVYSIVKAMNGTIHVESEIGVGTTFEFTFNLLTTQMNLEESEGKSKGLIVK